MFFSECARLALEQPELARLIERLDAQLQRAGTGVLRANDLAEIIGEDPRLVQGAMERLADYGALRRDEMLECPRCQTLTALEEHEHALEEEEESLCSNCQHDLARLPSHTIRVFRANPPVVPAASPVSPPNLQLPQSPADINEPLDPAFLQDVFRLTPLLRYYAKSPDLQGVKPLSGLRVIFILHFLRDLIPFIEGLIQLGLAPRLCWVFFKTYPYPQRHAVADWLRNKGFSIAPVSRVASTLRQLEGAPADRRDRILVIEDGGFVAPALHRDHAALLESTVGVVEQTTRGIMNLEDFARKSGQQIKLPVLSVAGSELKARFEPPYIGKAVIQNIERLASNLALRGRKAAVLGCGTIGAQVLGWLRQNGVDVRAFDLDPSRRLAVQQDGYALADTAQEAVEGRSLVIGCSGRTSVNSAVIAALGHGCYIVSASSEQYEIDVEELTRQASHSEELRLLGRLIGTTYTLPANSRQVHLLANGYPVNFWGMNSMPEQASDLVMSLLFLAAAELARGSYRAAGINVDAINELAVKHKVAEKFLEFWR